MLKKVILSLILLCTGLGVCANEQVVLVSAPAKVTTSDISLREGDEINFILGNDIYVNAKLYARKNEKVKGLITSLEPNGFNCKEASIYAENFVLKNVEGSDVKLEGILYVKGRTHWMFTQFIPFIPTFIRGGEVQIKPGDTFELIFRESV